MAIYLVTGVAGFIASAVSRALLQKGHTVIGIDNLNDAYDLRLKQWRINSIKSHQNFLFHNIDITDPGPLKELFQQSIKHLPIDAVINLAARAGVRQSVENPWLYFSTNLTGTLNLLENCRHFEVK